MRGDLRAEGAVQDSLGFALGTCPLSRLDRRSNPTVSQGYALGYLDSRLRRCGHLSQGPTSALPFPREKDECEIAEGQNNNERSSQP